ncbi:MAG TPA: SCO1664 family protein [Chloroflexota bacterium]
MSSRQHGRGRHERGGRRRYEAQALLQESRRLLESSNGTLDVLRESDISGIEVVPAGSNYTFLAVMVPRDGAPFLGIYKPRRGENPLWDYPDGTLYRREHASYVMSELLGWPNIPPTVIRDGPHGAGMAQLFVPQVEGDFFSFKKTHAEEMMKITLFDLLVNNGDRKAGHCLLGVDGRIWAIDHGLTFNPLTRVRTVLWDYCEEPIPEPLLAQLTELLGDPARRNLLCERLQRDLEEADVEALFRRVEGLVRTGRFPNPDSERSIPWPPF